MYEAINRRALLVGIFFVDIVVKILGRSSIHQWRILSAQAESFSPADWQYFQRKKFEFTKEAIHYPTTPIRTPPALRATSPAKGGFLNIRVMP
jgi:hypothetical protein